MAREQVEAASKEQVLTSLGAAASRLREKLGESLASIQKFDVPLPRATTPSLDALHAYSLALDEGRVDAAARSDSAPQARDRARSRLRAWRRRCCPASTPTPASRRWRRRSRGGRSSCGTASASASGSSSRGATTATRCRPGTRRSSWRDPGRRRIRAKRSRSTASAARSSASASSSSRSSRFARPSASIRSSSRRISNLAAALHGAQPIRRGDGPFFRQAADRQLDFIGARRLVVSARVRRRAMRRRWRASSKRRSASAKTNAAFGWQAHPPRSPGAITAAHEQFRRGIQMSLQGEFQEVAAQLTMEDAETHAIVGQCAEARRRSDGLGLEPRQRHARARQPRAGAVRRGPRGCGSRSELAQRSRTRRSPCACRCR